MQNAKIQTIFRLTGLIVLFLLFGRSTMAQSISDSNVKTSDCYKWQTQVDPAFERIFIDNSKLTNQDILVGIECLLDLQGNKKTARFTGYTNISRSIASPPPPIKKSATIEVAALYYISYIYYQNWEHAGSVRLFDAETNKTNSNKIIKRAYQSYRKWFEKVKEIGLEKAREQKLDPLKGSGISWS